MSTFILILFFHVGAIGSGNSNAVTNITGFTTEEEFMSAGARAKKLVAGSVKELNYTCVAQSKGGSQ